jgi:hypothetical protein
MEKNRFPMATKITASAIAEPAEKEDMKSVNLVSALRRLLG